MRVVRAMIDHEVRLCDRDELYLVEKNKDIEKYASSLSELKQKAFDIPDKSSFQLPEFRRELLDHMTELQRKSSSAKDKFVKWLQFPDQLNPDQLNLTVNSVATFPKEKLLLPNDKVKNGVRIKGVVPIDKNTDSLYFVTEDSSTIKQLDLKTSLLTKVSFSAFATILYIWARPVTMKTGRAH